MMGFSLFPPGVPRRKRLFDLALTLPGLVLLSPVMLLIAGLVWLIEGRPVLFSQLRPGYHARIITVTKFRTMRSAFDRSGLPLPDAQRLSRLGRVLRASSL